MSETKYRQNPVIAWREIDSEAVLVDPRSGEIRVLNRTGSAVWMFCGKARTLSDISDHVAGEFEIGAEEALPDIKAFIEDCITRDLIHSIGENTK